MPIFAVALIALVALAAGAAVGYLLVERRAGARTAAEAEALREEAQAEADAARRAAELKAKELLVEARARARKEAADKLGELERRREKLAAERRAMQERQVEVEQRARELAGSEEDLKRREAAAEAAARQAQETLARAERRLEELARVTADEARAMLEQQLTDEARREAAAAIAQVERESEAEAKRRATEIIAAAVQRYASDYVSERTVAVVQLPSDEMKGRIIGREGRNIRALEAATGVDIIIDDTPEAVILSCFHPVRREVAQLALARLIADGRIHPARIEEVVEKANAEVQAGCREAGEQAVYDLGLHGINPELIRLLGEMRYRTSYAQNLLQHSVEVGYIAGLMASELGVSVKLARRAGLLHDIGKAVDHEAEGSHAQVGANLAKRHGESAKVVHAIAAHHGEAPKQDLLDHIVDAANQLSARRPGARRERLQAFVQRLYDLERLAGGFEGVRRAFAIQAGREVRIMVENESVTDDMALALSREIARKVEEELSYPGQVKVCVLRESRASAVAR